MSPNEEVADALDVNALADEAERLFEIYKKPHLHSRILRQMMRKHFPNGTKHSVIERAEISVRNEIFRRMGERAQLASPEVRAGKTPIEGRPMIIGYINHGRWGKDAAAGAEVEDRQEAI